jgi:hypothetical protein
LKDIKDLFKKKYCYVVFDNPDRQNTIKLQEILQSHPSKATDPIRVHGSTDGVAVHLKYTNEINLTSNLENLRQSVPDTIIKTWASYTAYFPSPNKERLSNLFKLWLYVLIVTFASYMGFSIKQSLETGTPIPYNLLIINGLITGSITGIVTVFTIKAKKLEGSI